MDTCFSYSLLEIPVLLEATSHFVANLQVSKLGPVDSLSSKLVTTTITLLLEVLSITINITSEMARTRKDEPLQLLNKMIKDWIQAKIGNCKTTRKIFGGGMKKPGFLHVNQAEDFVDLPREFQVLTPQFVI